MQNVVTSTLRVMKEEVQRRVTEAASATADSDWLNCEMLRSNQRWYVVISVDIFKDENEFVPISPEKSTARANAAVNSIESVVFFVAFPRSKSWQIVLTRWWLNAAQCTWSDEGCSETLGTGYQLADNFGWFPLPSRKSFSKYIYIPCYVLLIDVRTVVESMQVVTQRSTEITEA